MIRRRWRASRRWPRGSPDARRREAAARSPWDGWCWSPWRRQAPRDQVSKGVSVTMSPASSFYLPESLSIWAAGCLHVARRRRHLQRCPNMPRKTKMPLHTIKLPKSLPSSHSDYKDRLFNVHFIDSACQFVAFVFRSGVTQSPLFYTNKIVFFIFWLWLCVVDVFLVLVSAKYKHTIALLSIFIRLLYVFKWREMESSS